MKCNMSSLLLCIMKSRQTRFIKFMIYLKDILNSIAFLGGIDGQESINCIEIKS